jgi:DNA-binding NarL/FixJ family response regulator
MKNTMPIQIAITDDHPMIIDGLTNALQQDEGITIIGKYKTGKDLLKSLQQQQQPDVLLLDVQLPDLNGLELTKIIKKEYPNIYILILSGIESHYYILDLIHQGCNGYLLKSTTDQRLLSEGIRAVYKGELFLDPSVKQTVLQEMLRVKRKKNASPKLTEREKEVLQLIIKEYSNQEIAEKLCISLRTAENHRYNLLQKLDVKNTVGLVKVALQMGFDV